MRTQTYAQKRDAYTHRGHLGCATDAGHADTITRLLRTYEGTYRHPRSGERWVAVAEAGTHPSIPKVAHTAGSDLRGILGRPDTPRSIHWKGVYESRNSSVRNVDAIHATDADQLRKWGRVFK